MKKITLFLIFAFLCCFIPANAAGAATPKLNNYIRNNNVQYVKFVTEVRKDNYVDVSCYGNKSCRAWMEDGVLCVGPNVEGKVRWYNVTDDIGQYFLNGCESLVWVDVTNLDVSSAMDLSFAFYGCYNLKEIVGLETWDTSNVTNMQGTFSMGNPYVHSGGCSGIVTYSNGRYTCSKCGRLSSWTVSGYSDLAAITDLSGINNWDVSNVVNMSALFYGDKYLSNIDLSNWDTGHVTSFCHTFCRCDLSDELVKMVEHWDTSSADNFDAMFVRGQFTTIDISNWDTSNCINMAEVFGYCSKLTNVTFGQIDTSNVQTFEQFFIGCSSLQEVDISCFNTCSVPEGDGYVISSGYIFNEYGFQEMFKGCAKLNKITVGDKWRVTSKMLQTDMWLNCPYEVEVRNSSNAPGYVMIQSPNS